jgi:hypothetical protein
MPLFSSQIEGTRATLMDALELDAGVQTKETDADDILFYSHALKLWNEAVKEISVVITLL